MPSELIYLARGRLQRPRANLVQTLHTVEALAAAGAKTRLYLPPVPRSFDLPAFLRSMGIRHPIDLRCTESMKSQWGGWPFVLLHRGELLRAKALYTRVPDMSLLLARMGIPHFLEAHDTEPLAKTGVLARLVENARRGLIRGFVTVSEAGRAALIEQGADSGQVHTIPNGVDLESFSAVAPLTLDDVRDPGAVYVGRVSRDRGLSIFERIAHAGFSMLVVGPRDDEPVPHPNLSVEGAVAHADVPQRLSRGAIALMPYQADLNHATSISPIKMFEAMAAGRVVIASDLPPIREIVRNGENGLLVKADDPAAWVGAMTHLRENPEFALTLAEAGRATARHYGWNTRAERLLTLTGLRPA